MPDFQNQILTFISRRSYEPLKPKALARKLGVPTKQYGDFRRVLRSLMESGRAEIGKNQTVRATRPHGTATGIYRRAASGVGFVRPHSVDGQFPPEILIRSDDSLDAATGDEVLVRITRKPNRPDQGPAGEIIQIHERATRQFVGTYFERDGQSFVRVDSNIFNHSVYVGDPGAKGARPEDKVVFEMVSFPSVEDRGEGVITEVLGPRGKPGVDTLSTIRALGLPDEFPPAVLEEAREAASAFRETDLDDRDDFTGQTVITIDPVDARDFDDAVSLTVDPKSKHWHLSVHIADVGHFAPPGSALDQEARKRATSVYLPQRVIPMFPEIISNGLASLQQGKNRYVKSALMDFTAAGVRTSAQFANGVIRNRRRFSYEEVSAILANEPNAAPPAGVSEEIVAMLFRMRDFAMILHKRRLKRGSLELHMPEAELEYDDNGKVVGAHFAKHDMSHQMIEEFMLAANEAVAEQLTELEVPFLRRVHPQPEPTRLLAFADFARGLGYQIEQHTDRFALQRVLQQSAAKPDVFAVHYALLRSLKKAVYSPEVEEHYALASKNYAHFTSPIRRYPDLTVHRQLAQWLRTGRAGADETELKALGEHCSKMERRAEVAERELIKVRLLDYMNQRLGLELEVIITGVADYGFFGQPITLPIEGLVHISTLTDDYYFYDEATHSLIGRRTKNRYRLGDKVKAKVVRVDLQRRQLDFRVTEKLVEAPPPEPTQEKAPESRKRKKTEPFRGKKKKRRE